MDFRVCTACGLATAAGIDRCPRCDAATVAADARTFVGQMFGKYRLVDLIGSGGMGVVLRGTHATLGRDVAVKLLQPGLGDAAFRERFLREARLLAGLHHPNVVEVHDFDVSPGDVPYYVMELLVGDSLARRIADAPRGLSWPDCVPILRGIVAALSYAHGRGIVHRDLKPDNVFIVRDAGGERVKLLDFGIARLVDEGADAPTRLTQTGLVIGTPQYFAPEQFYGYPVTLATDQYALALLIAEMLRGRPLRSGRSFSEISLEGLARAPAGITAELPTGTPAAVVQALAVALAVDPDERHASVEAFAHALGLDERTAQAPVGAPTRPAPRLTAPAPGTTRLVVARSPRRTFAIALALAAALLVAAAFRYAQHRNASAPPSASAPSAEEAAPGVATIEAQPKGWLRRRAELRVPVDARSVLTRTLDVAVLASADGWYLRPLDRDVEASRVTLPAGQRLIGALEDGSLAVLEGAELRAVDPLKGAARPLARLPGAIDAASMLTLAPDGRAALVVSTQGAVLYRRDGDAFKEVAKWPETTSAQAVALSREQVALVTGDAKRVRVWRRDGTPVLDQALDLGGVREIALLDAPGRLALAASGPELLVLDLAGHAAPLVLSLPQGAQALAWIADAPTLLAAGDRGIALVRDGAFLSERSEDIVSASGGLHADGSGVLALDTNTHKLAWLDYGVLPLAEQHALGTQETWALHATTQPAAVFVGSRDGTLHELSHGAIKHHALHTDGVTALAGDAEHLASASDDRTLAIWNLPAMDVQWRTRGHDYLVNQLVLANGSLWSSSSDGTLKRWRWPTLEEEETIDLRALTGAPDTNLHAFWIDASATHALVGTWNDRLIALDRVDGRWRARSMPIDSHGGYRLVEVPNAHIVVVLGTEPTRVHVWDIDERHLLRVPDLDDALFGLAVDREGQGVYAAGRGVIVHCVFERAAAGLSVRIAAARRSELREIGAIDLDPATGVLWMGNNAGGLFAVDTARLPPPLHEALLVPEPSG
ncbi:protein kinase domain-containing protein [Dokdonella sp.]|uniref:protein kinase domain-containing protein n=1 Tax=Dokdonella sp. TaxID=2291710 RepID=UPI003783BF74